MLTSPHNPRLSRVRALLEKRKAREEEQAFVVEGVRLAEEALAAGWLTELVLYASQLSERGMEVVRGFQQQGAEVWEVPPKLMDSLSGTETAPGLLAVLPMRTLPLPGERQLPQELALPEELNFVLIMDNLRDPGNLGTLLRTAAAAGVQAALLSPGTTDAFAPKVLRAGMGAHFRLPIRALDWEGIRAACQEMAIFLAEAGGGSACWDTDLKQPLALIMGSEAEGASAPARSLAGHSVTIPMPGKSESLNVAVAAGILLFEVVRQRRAVP